MTALTDRCGGIGVDDLDGQLMAVAVEARSADRNLRAWARGHDRLGMEFVGSSYRSYVESTLVAQLNPLATSVWTRYRRAYIEVMDAFLGRTGDAHDDGVDAAYWKQIENVTAAGWSCDGAMTVTTRGLARWDFQIEAGTLRHLDGRECGVELTTAVADAVANYRAQTVLLIAEVYGPPARRTRSSR